MFVAVISPECDSLLPESLVKELNEIAPKHNIVRLSRMPKPTNGSVKRCLHVVTGDFNGDSATDHGVLLAGKPYAKIFAALADGDGWKISELKTYHLRALDSVISTEKPTPLEHTETYDFDPKEGPFWVESARPKHQTIHLGSAGEGGGGIDYFYDGTAWHGVQTGC